MMNSTFEIVIAGCLLGALQLGVGVSIGLWLRRGNRAVVNRGHQEMVDAGRIAQRLQALTGEVSSSLGVHKANIEKASETLANNTAADGKTITELVVAVIGDIVLSNQSLQTKLETAEQRLQEQSQEIQRHISRSLTDTLTGLPNRREFDQRLAERMAGWARRGEVFSLLLLDVDNFKKLNDLHGHLAGDLVLTTLGRGLRSVLRRDDSVARYGGEEFAMILPATTCDQASQISQKICDATARATVQHGGNQLAVTLSGGLATIQRGERPESLISRADAALYAAKAAGRNRFFLHDGKHCRAAFDASSPASGATPGQDPAGRPAPQNARTSNGLPARSTTDSAAAQERSVSAELAQVCLELREHVRERTEDPAEEVSHR